MPGLLTSERLSAMCLVDLETFPILGQPVIRVWLVVHDDTSMHLDLCCPRVPVYGYSRFPKRFHHPVWRFRFFLPAFDPRLPGACRGKGLSPVHQGGRSFLRYRLLSGNRMTRHLELGAADSGYAASGTHREPAE